MALRSGALVIDIVQRIVECQAGSSQLVPDTYGGTVIYPLHV
jgi:hypothetical protein